jgi:hypothetical protein
MMVQRTYTYNRLTYNPSLTQLCLGTVSSSSFPPAESRVKLSINLKAPEVPTQGGPHQFRSRVEPRNQTVKTHN